MSRIRKLSMLITHPNLVRCFVMDRGEERMVFPQHHITFAEWHTTQATYNVYPAQAFTFPTGFYSADCLTQDAVYVPDVYKEQIRGLVRFLVYLHESEMTTCGFSPHNLVVEEGQLKFYKIKTKYFTPHLSVNQRAVRSDYVSLKQFLLNEIFSGYTLPHQMKHFLRLLNSRSIRHVALMSHAQTVSCWENRLTLESVELGKYRRAISQLGDNTGWSSRVNREPLLNCYMNHQTSGGQPYPFNTLFSTVNVDAMIMHAFGDKIAEFQMLLWEKDILNFFI
ncbi:uncharacterized protein LOC126676873 isoform X2 [Mercurialis annua]|uniref:uncharacterized protein LOC126676873 isoform X2 n=1 Tax=Mercurialis annua TaxID=3986 RepID=UPI002160B12C|nr:uncharacterized protein LOC126676873 isoform X2 [Mercurialis annua]